MDIETSMPQRSSGIQGSVESVDHNMYIIGDKMYQSNYTSRRVLDVAMRQTALELVGYFDTNPESDAIIQRMDNYVQVATSAWYVPHFFMLRPSDAIARIGFN